MWMSDKIRSLPPWAKAEFAWLLPLAMANGVFECDPRLILVRCYAYTRPEMTLEQVVEVLHAFQNIGLLFRWRELDGKEWGYWVGIEKEGRLPPLSRIRRKECVIGPQPPKNELLSFTRTRYVRNTSDGQVRLGLGYQDSKSSSESSKALPAPRQNQTIDDFKKIVLAKCEDPEGTIDKTLDIIIERAESSGTKIKSPAYLEKALNTFNFQDGNDREALMQRVRRTPL